MKHTGPQRRIVLAHSFDLVVKGLRSALEGFPELRLSRVVHNRADLEAALQEGCDLVVTGLYMPGLDGLAGVESLVRSFPGVRFAILTAYPQYHKQAKKAGIPGYIMKSESASRIAQALSLLASGGSYYTPDLSRNAEAPGRPSPPPDLLSGRELEVLLAVAEGRKNADIGRSLAITTRTVEFHKAKIKEKLRLETSADLIRYVYENRLAGS